MQAFEISGYDAVVWKRIRETAGGAAFERALKFFAREAPFGRNGSGLPAARNGGVKRGGKAMRFVGWHFCWAASEEE